MFRNTKGASSVEYAILVGVLAFGGFTSLSVFADRVNDMYIDATNSIVIEETIETPVVEDDDGNNGHGNDEDRCDESNPGKGKGPKACR